MKVLIANEKYVTRCFDVTTDEQRDKVAAKLINERLIEDFYTDTQAAKRAIENNKAYSFLASRKHYEYEGFEIVELEGV